MFGRVKIYFEDPLYIRVNYGGVKITRNLPSRYYKKYYKQDLKGQPSGNDERPSIVSFYSNFTKFEEGRQL